MLFHKLVHDFEHVLGDITRTGLQPGQQDFAAIGKGEPIGALVCGLGDQVA
ncbi:hypothetical protein D3C85_1261360 [compost metagenome]